MVKADDAMGIMLANCGNTATGGRLCRVDE